MNGCYYNNISMYKSRIMLRFTNIQEDLLMYSSNTCRPKGCTQGYRGLTDDNENVRL